MQEMQEKLKVGSYNSSSMLSKVPESRSWLKVRIMCKNIILVKVKVIGNSS